MLRVLEWGMEWVVVGVVVVAWPAVTRTAGIGGV